MQSFRRINEIFSHSDAAINDTDRHDVQASVDSGIIQKMGTRELLVLTDDEKGRCSKGMSVVKHQGGQEGQRS